MPNRRSSTRKIILALLSLSLVFISISISWLPVSASDTDHTMDEKAVKKWTYNSWTPTAMGTYIFTIHAEDMEGNWAQESSKIEIVTDATPPEVKIIYAPKEEIEGGKTVIFTVYANDTYAIKQVLFEFEGLLEPMVNLHDTKIWEYKLKVPIDGGEYIYIIYVEDINNNWNYTSGSINVIGIPSIAEDHPYVVPFDINGLLILVISIIGIILSVSVVAYNRMSKRAGDQRSLRSTQLISDQPYIIRNPSRIIEVKCPSCYTSKDLPLSISIPSDSNGLCNVYIDKNIVCEHSFQIYVDSFHSIRGSELIDYTLGEELKKRN